MAACLIGGRDLETDFDSVLTAAVAVDKCLFPFDMLYDYIVPRRFEDSIGVGQLVTVPFGKGNKKRIALVYGLERKSCDPAKLKPIIDISQNGIALSDEQLALSA